MFLKVYLKFNKFYIYIYIFLYFLNKFFEIKNRKKMSQKVKIEIILLNRHYIIRYNRFFY